MNPENFEPELPAAAAQTTLRVDNPIPFISQLQECAMIRTNSNHRQRGFTLVEVIVVAVIVAAMAAVAVPVYLNYVANSQLNAATNAAGSAASFLGACGNGGGDVEADLPAAMGSITGGEGIAVDCVAGTGDMTVLNVPTDITLERDANMVRGMHGTAGMWSVWYSF